MARKPNSLIALADADGRDYITPEDVAAALDTIPRTRVRLDLLEVLGRQTNYGVEDSGCAAFVAWNGKGSAYYKDEDGHPDV